MSFTDKAANISMQTQSPDSYNMMTEAHTTSWIWEHHQHQSHRIWTSHGCARSCWTTSSSDPATLTLTDPYEGI